VTYANPAFLRLSGYTFDELVGRNVRILRGVQYGETFYTSLREKIVRGEVWDRRISPETEGWIGDPGGIHDLTD